MEVCTCSGCHGNLRLPRGWPFPQSPMKPGTQEWGHTHTHILGFAKLFLRVLPAFFLFSISLGEAETRAIRRG